MGTITRFEEVRAWQAARQLTRELYRYSGRGEFARDRALVDQIRRAAVSVMSNIAEGFESRTQTLFIDYLGRAKASCGEVRSQLYVALDADYLRPAEFDSLQAEAEMCGRQIAAFIQYLSTQPKALRVREEGPVYEADDPGVGVPKPSTFNLQPPTNLELNELQAKGWRLTRDGSTGTALFAWDDPEGPESGWEILVLHTAGHRSRFTLNVAESGLTERSPEDMDRLLAALGEARELLREWRGELPEEE